MSLNQIGGVLEGLLAGLAAAEQHGIVHRDLKPENLMVTSDGRIKIADFGIAKATTRMQTGAFLTGTGTTVGTPTYMAPEQAMAQDIGPWTDLYSVGCMAYELFTHNVPFHDSEAPMAILLRHVNEEIAPASSVADVDEEVSAWIERLLVKDPPARTQSAGTAWDELEEILIGKLGPRWRREARLFDPGETERPAGAPGTGETPIPLTPAPFDGAAPPSLPDQGGGFVTFGAQAPDAGPATPASVTPPPAEAVPQASAGAPAPAPPAQEPAPAADENAGFETYIAPPPLRPPTDEPAEPPAAAPPPPAPTPAPPAAAPPPPTPVPTPPPAPAPPPPAAAPAPPPAAAPAPPPAAAPVTPPAPMPVADAAATVMPDSVKPPVVAEPPVPAAPEKAPKPAGQAQARAPAQARARGRPFSGAVRRRRRRGRGRARRRAGRIRWRVRQRCGQRAGQRRHGDRRPRRLR